MRELRRNGCRVVGVLRDHRTLVLDAFCEEVYVGDLGDVQFVSNATRDCSHIIDMVNQLMPPCESVAGGRVHCDVCRWM
jgi:hypothetical protein